MASLVVAASHEGVAVVGFLEAVAVVSAAGAAAVASVDEAAIERELRWALQLLGRTLQFFVGLAVIFVADCWTATCVGRSLCRSSICEGHCK